MEMYLNNAENLRIWLPTMYIEIYRYSFRASVLNFLIGNLQTNSKAKDTSLVTILLNNNSIIHDNNLSMSQRNRTDRKTVWKNRLIS